MPDVQAPRESEVLMKGMSVFWFDFAQVARLLAF